MHSLISKVGVVLFGKENYPEWLWNIKHTLIFNELRKGVCVGEGDNELTNPPQVGRSPFGKTRTTRPMP